MIKSRWDFSLRICVPVFHPRASHLPLSVVLRRAFASWGLLHGKHG
jgi:hypothetical protein